MKIEEITDEMEKAMNLGKPLEASASSPQVASSSTQAEAKDNTTPDLPPSLAINKGKTADEILADLNKSPLFMTELEDNIDIEALQALNYEGTAYENASGFRERGNECFKVKGYVDAKEFYNKGILILADLERKRERGEKTVDPEGVEDTEEEITNQKSLLEALYGNRAACHLALSNFRSCWLDCAAALRLNPRNIKACYRSAKALLAVDRIIEADDICARGLALDPENASLKAVAEDIIKRAKAVDAKKRKENERQAREKRREMLVKAALKARGIPTRSTDKPPEMEDAAVALAPDPDDPRSTLTFPTVLLYPLDLQSDFIKAFAETETLDDHLSYILPLPWDQKGDYASAAAVECYLETRDGGVLKMGKRVSLLKALGTGKVEVVDGVVKVFVVPKGKAEAWVKEFKEKKAATSGKRF
ncbi:hsp70/Hsp90 co-chaperone cns1 [Sarocladium implicatum]|nr:hsp70/Hsp90 co-chaperone cns1 [Sarocladium implicatum]